MKTVWDYFQTASPSYIEWVDIVNGVYEDNVQCFEECELDSVCGVHCRRLIDAMHVFLSMADPITTKVHESAIRSLAIACRIVITG